MVTAMICLAWLGVISLEILHNFRAESFLWGYGTAILAAFALYHFFARRLDVQNRFIYSRGIAEALRIQRHWSRDAGIDEPVAAHYLEGHDTAFAWIRTLVKSVGYLEADSTGTLDPDRVMAGWIEGQIAYFDAAVKDMERRFHRLKRVEHFFYLLGLGATLVMFVCFFLEEFHIHLPVSSGFLSGLLHLAIFTSGSSLATAAFFNEKYLKVKGYKEEITNFTIMGRIFRKARQRFQSAPDAGEQRRILLDLGIRALEENSKWVVTHGSRRVKPGFD